MGKSFLNLFKTSLNSCWNSLFTIDNLDESYEIPCLLVGKERVKKMKRIMTRPPKC